MNKKILKQIAADQPNQGKEMFYVCGVFLNTLLKQLIEEKTFKQRLESEKGLDFSNPFILAMLVHLRKTDKDQLTTEHSGEVVQFLVAVLESYVERDRQGYFQYKEWNQHKLNEIQSIPPEEFYTTAVEILWQLADNPKQVKKQLKLKTMFS